MNTQRRIRQLHLSVRAIDNFSYSDLKRFLQTFIKKLYMNLQSIISTDEYLYNICKSSWHEVSIIQYDKLTMQARNFVKRVCLKHSDYFVH